VTLGQSVRTIGRWRLKLNLRNSRPNDGFSGPTWHPKRRPQKKPPEGLSFDLSDNLNALTSPSIQYKNGAFNGFNFITNFSFQAKDYEFRIKGTAITVRLIDPNSGFATGAA
jgi:hypothetical protein